MLALMIGITAALGSWHSGWACVSSDRLLPRLWLHYRVEYTPWEPLERFPVACAPALHNGVVPFGSRKPSCSSRKWETL